MHGIGSSESLQQKKKTDVCTWSQRLHTRLDTLKTKKQKSQKQPVAHDMTPSHVKQLKLNYCHYMAETLQIEGFYLVWGERGVEEVGQVDRS